MQINSMSKMKLYLDPSIKINKEIFTIIYNCKAHI